MNSDRTGRETELAAGKLVYDEPADNVARLRLSNPHKRGALDHEVLDALNETVRNVDARCIVLTGTGRVFSAGYDLGNLSDEADFAAIAETLVAHPFHAAIEAIEQCSVPVICAINGHAIGGGLELALSCDMRIAANQAKFGMPPAKLGLVYSHTGIAKFLRACGPANTSELFFVGDNIDAARAERIGLVNSVCDSAALAEQALAVARSIAANAPLSVAGNKRIIKALERNANQLPAEIERELIELREACFGSEDFREGVRAFAQKRPARWQGR